MTWQGRLLFPDLMWRETKIVTTGQLSRERDDASWIQCSAFAFQVPSPRKLVFNYPLPHKWPVLSGHHRGSEVSLAGPTFLSCRSMLMRSPFWIIITTTIKNAVIISWLGKAKHTWVCVWAFPLFWNPFAYVRGGGGERDIKGHLLVWSN